MWGGGSISVALLYRTLTPDGGGAHRQASAPLSSVWTGLKKALIVPKPDF